MARTASKRKPARKRPQRRRSASPFQLPVLEPHHRDLIGLGAVAFGCFLAVVLYGGETGGRVGEITADALRFLLGGVAYLAPAGFVAAGAVVVLRDSLPSLRPFRAGALCLTLGLTLGLAAGTLGLGPGAEPHEPLLEASYVSDRGGVVGELLLWGSSTLFSTVGAHILVVFLLAGGVLLLTGASLASVLRGPHRRARSASGAIRSGGRRPSGAARRRAGRPRHPRRGARARRRGALPRPLPGRRRRAGPGSRGRLGR